MVDRHDPFGMRSELPSVAQLFFEVLALVDIEEGVLVAVGVLEGLGVSLPSGEFG